MEYKLWVLIFLSNIWGMYSVIPVYDVPKRYEHRLCGLGIGEADHDCGSNVMNLMVIFKHVTEKIWKLFVHKFIQKFHTLNIEYILYLQQM